MKILNEVEYAENMLKSGFIQKKYEYELKILSKYLYSLDIKDEVLKSYLIWFCKFYIKGFNEVKYIKMLKRATNFCANNSLFVVHPIRITPLEIDKIKSLDNLKIERVMFVLLVLSKINRQSYILYIKDKINKIISENNKRKKNKKTYKELIKIFPTISSGYYTKEKINNIFNLAKVYLKKKEKNEILKLLIDKGFIKMTKSCKYKINIINHKTLDTSLKLINFNDFVLEYEKLCGENIGYCTVCNNPIRIKVNNHKYCNKCSKEKIKERDRLRKKEIPHSENALKSSNI